MRIIRLACWIIVLTIGLSQSFLTALSDKVKYDPFIPLIDPTGRIKSETELVRPVEIPLNITLKGIIWSKDKPLAVINNKIYREGAVIFENIILQKINPDNIILSNQGEKVKIDLRKKEKK